MTILIVEDDPASFAYLKKIITSNHNCAVLLAENGIQALKVLEEDHIDGIISDVSMPMMSGLELLEVLVANKETKDIPIMMTSANNTRIDVEKALKLGATDYLLKPLMAHETLSRINRFVGHIKSRQEEVINKNTNTGQKNVLVISPNKESWEKVISDSGDEFKFTLFASAPDGLAHYMQYFPAFVVLENNNKILNDEFIAKKIKKLIDQKAMQKVYINTKIIGVGNFENSGFFDESIDSPKNLHEILIVDTAVTENEVEV